VRAISLPVVGYTNFHHKDTEDPRFAQEQREATEGKDSPPSGKGWLPNKFSVTSVTSCLKSPSLCPYREFNLVSVLPLRLSVFA